MEVVNGYLIVEVVNGYLIVEVMRTLSLELRMHVEMHAVLDENRAKTAQ